MTDYATGIIYGTGCIVKDKEKNLNWINYHLPADIKKIPYIRNTVDKKYNGETGCIYYQSRKEILKILKWIDVTPRHEGVWDRWQQTVSSVEQYA